MSDEDLHSRRVKTGAWSPLLYATFRALWIANVASNVGTWIQHTGTAWLMTTLALSPVMVSLVQTANSLPIFLLALPAGALSDVVDRRRLLLFTQTWMLAAAAGLGFLTLAGLTTPWALLAFTLLLGLGHALNAPTWQAIVPELVPKAEIPAAVALNSAGFNVARAIGPAVGGLIVSMAGSGVAFLLNAASFLGVILVVLSWKRPPRESRLPAERILGAMRAGIRYVRHAPALQAVFIRSVAFSVCGSAVIALLPLLARQELGLGAVGYGVLLGFFGIGAVGGAVFLPSFRRRITIDRLVTLSCVLFAGTLALLGLTRLLPVVWGALAFGGAVWLALLASFNSSVQAVAPNWVRGRALSIYMLILFGGMAGGSALWGVAASLWGITASLLLSAGVLILGTALTMRFRLSGAEGLDLTPSMHWPTPALPTEPRPEEGPVLVTIEYRVDPREAPAFAAVMGRMRRARLRDGAIQWSLFVDTTDPERYVESFLVESWIEHLRQHERVTVSDRQLEDRVRAFHKGKEPPRVEHFLSTPV